MRIVLDMAAKSSIVNRSSSVEPALSDTMREEFHRIHAARHELHRRAHCLQTCTDQDVPITYHELLKTLEQMFGAEQRLMEKYAFPVRQSHLEQHARVLRGLHCVHAAVLRGATDQGRQVGGHLLIDWLQLHQHTVDATLMIWADYCDCGLIDPHHTHWSGTLTAR